MIHSMSGGVLADNEVYTFVKVEVLGAPRWYLSRTAKLKAGDKVVVPADGGSAEGIVLRVENGTRQTSPLPLARMKYIEVVPSNS